jgi:hypothetical protein
METLHDSDVPTRPADVLDVTALDQGITLLDTVRELFDTSDGGLDERTQRLAFETLSVASDKLHIVLDQLLTPHKVIERAAGDPPRPPSKPPNQQRFRRKKVEPGLRLRESDEFDGFSTLD